MQAPGRKCPTPSACRLCLACTRAVWPSRRWSFPANKHHRHGGPSWTLYYSTPHHDLSHTTRDRVHFEQRKPPQRNLHKDRPRVDGCDGRPAHGRVPTAGRFKMPAASSLGARAMTATSVPPEERRFSVATVWSQSTFNTLSTSGGTSARPSSTLCSGADTLVEKELSAARGVPEDLHLRVPRRLVHPTVRPGLRRLLGWLAPRDAVLLLLPAFAASVCSSGVPVAMTHVVGRAFASFLAYDGSAPGELRRQVRVDACVLLSLIHI